MGPQRKGKRMFAEPTFIASLSGLPAIQFELDEFQRRRLLVQELG